MIGSCGDVTGGKLPVSAQDSAPPTWLMSSLRTAGETRVRVIGRSMLPLLRLGDNVWVEPIKAELLQRGDIVVVWRDGGLLTHRFLDVVGGYLYTKGDNCRSADTPIVVAAMLGRVVFVERGSKRINLRTRWWLRLNGWIATISCHEAARIAWLLRVHADHRVIPQWMAAVVLRSMALPFRVLLSMIVYICLQLAGSRSVHHG